MAAKWDQSRPLLLRIPLAIWACILLVLFSTIEVGVLLFMIANRRLVAGQGHLDIKTLETCLPVYEFSSPFLIQSFPRLF